MSTLRVLHVVVAGEIGGAERMLVDLASRPEATHATHAIALMTPSNALRRFLTGAGLEIVDRGPVREHAIATLARSVGPRDVRWLLRQIADLRADVVHLHTFGSQVVGTRAAIRAGKPVLRTEHSTRVYDDPSCWPLSAWSLRRTDLAIAVSRHVREVAIRRAPWVAERMRVVHNGVQLERFTETALPETTTLRIVFVGRLEPRKGPDLAVDAMALAPGVALDIVGDGPMRRKLERRIRQLGLGDRVALVGHAADPRPILERAHLALAPSRKEGLGIAALEAMAVGRPVIATRSGGLEEVVSDGETGWLTAAEPSAIAARIRQAGAPTADRETLSAMGTRARRRVERHFSLGRTLEGYAEAYGELGARFSRSRASL